MATKIFIDQGHNPSGVNAGAEGNGLREQDINYKVGVALADLLNSNPSYEALLSRPTPDTALGTTNASSLAARVDAANNWGADFFISIHANASTNTSASGSEGYVYSTSTPAYGLSLSILRGLNSSTGLANRGVFVRPSLYVLRRTIMPATLIELGFITNSYDANLMNTEPELFARGIYNGIISYLG